MVKVTILGCGTSTGVPIPGCGCRVCRSSDLRNRRLRTSALLSTSTGTKVIIDTSTDLRAQALAHGIEHLDAVIYTHAHADHILGIDDLRCFNFTRQGSIPCYATAQTRSEIERMFWYVFAPDKSYEGGLIAQLSMHELAPGVPCTIAGLPIEPFQLFHGSTEVIGIKCGNFGYATDCNRIPPDTERLLTGIDTLVLDGLRYEPHRTHFTIPEAVSTAKRLGARRTILTHMSHSVDYEETMAQLPPGVELAYDGLTLEIE